MTFQQSNESKRPPLIERGRRQVFREQGGADFTVTAVDETVVATGESLTLHVASVKDGRPGAVCLVVLRSGEQDELLLARHWRVATGEWDWEFPRGMGEADENPETTALRELCEETGIRAQLEQVHILSSIHADAGVLRDDVRVAQVLFTKDEDIRQVLEVVPRAGKAEGTDWELSDLQWVKAQDFRALAVAGYIVDGLTLAAFAIYEWNKADGVTCA
ncbi:hypothetical protein KIM372_17520 [Bombiscardovia nodaiensis]|uniref:Nudix hydrolase domain-containing protein n=1 Tax=Bombiscardovia nodaiensis TaxID=2932181 RepID=A0ABN6SG33_9BIFI|nr:hypothetical protein KIM372_17520 [Bombiscardovia nodaiensis]